MGVLTGGCLCGGVRFEVAAPLIRANHCHCSRCRRHSGTAVCTQTRVRREQFRLLRGDELIRVYRANPGEEVGEGFAVKAFCSVCGSAMFSRSGQHPELMSVRLGVLDADPELEITWRQYLAYAAPWEPIPDDGVPRYQEARPAGV